MSRGWTAAKPWARHYRSNIAARVMKDGAWFAPGTDVLHGRRDTYNRHGCRCEECRAASAAYFRARKEANSDEGAS